MSGAAQAWRQFGDGPLSRITSRVYILLVVELLLLLTTLPGLLPLLLLGRDPSNLPLVALFLVPVGPAISAALYALRHHRADLTDLRPAALFWRGYRENVSGVLRVWVPTLLWLTVLAVNLAYLDAIGLPAWWAVALVLLGTSVTLGAANALVIASLFDFRTRDVLRLAVHFLVRTPV
ncbi:YesL family protein [Micromonospora sp. M12]